MRQPDHKKPRTQTGDEKAYFFALPETRERTEMRHILDVKFDKAKNSYHYPDGLWMFQGALSWPIVVPDEGLVGMAMLGGYHIESRSVYLLSERKFIVIDGGEKYPKDAPRPLKPWFEWVYDNFAARRYYHLQVRGRGKEAPKSSTKKFTNRIHRVFQNPSPTMYGLDLEFHTAMQTVYEYVGLERFKHPGETRLWSEMQAYDANPDGSYPSLHAACILLNGLDRRLDKEYLIDKVLSKTSGDSP